MTDKDRKGLVQAVVEGKLPKRVLGLALLKQEPVALKFCNELATISTASMRLEFTDDELKELQESIPIKLIHINIDKETEELLKRNNDQIQREYE